MLTQELIDKRNAYAKMFEEEHYENFNLLEVYKEDSNFKQLDNEVLFGLYWFSCNQEKAYDKVEEIQQLLRDNKNFSEEAAKALEDKIKEQNTHRYKMFLDVFDIPRCYDREYVLSLHTNMLFAYMKIDHLVLPELHEDLELNDIN